ncbi:kinesin-like protein KIF12 isoform X1 [Callorhinchus milii]|uniref:kinesin-like protein KIF12 isoform X1 n=1 Tax=Callorhinchus milii TaxID=7868 RepID=UPI001C3FB109|nr:kinesin-like protein KIF12 isoform X1 [Callorhinchus milii]
MCSANSGAAAQVGDGSGEDGIQESNVLVALRIRPLNGSEVRRGTQSVLQCPGPNTVQVNLGVREKIFTFNAVFDQEASQQDIFDRCNMQRLISLALTGYACTVFAFGQTGSGKTFTVTGPVTMCAGGCREARLSGLMCRSLAALLEEARGRSAQFTFSASYLEIYNEQVRDLLNPRLSDSLPVRWSKHRGFYVENLFSAKFQSLQKIVGLLEEGTRNRQTSAHHLNGNSSRSHTLLTIEIESEAADHIHSPGFVSKHGKLCFVDLAGSERVKETRSTEEMIIEANNINRSLLALGNCISALVDCRKREGHIPYRDSKLTKLLAESLGGSGVTLMIACVSPSPLSLAETMSTLRFASRARRVKNRPAVRLDPKDKLIVGLQRGIRVLQTENMSLRQQLQLPLAHSNEKILNDPGDRCCDDCGCGCTLLASASQHSLYEMLQEFVIENEQLRQEKQQLLSSQESSRCEHRLLLQQNRRLSRKLCRLERAILSSPHGLSRCQSGCSCHSVESCESQTQPPGERSCSRYRQVSEVLNDHGPLLLPPSTPPIVPSAPPLPTPPRLRSEVTLPLRRSSNETSSGKPSAAEPRGNTEIKPDCWEPRLGPVARLHGNPGRQTPERECSDINTASSLCPASGK